MCEFHLYNKKRETLKMVGILIYFVTAVSPAALREPDMQ